MKGLLIKDIRLMWMQRKFFCMVLIMAVGVMAVTKNIDFMVWYFTFLCTVFVVSTISYDEYDNGNAFLFSLPISRSEYVREKYLFALLTGGATWLLMVPCYLIYQMKTVEDFRIAEGGSVMLVNIAVIYAMVAVMIPVQLRYGAERSKIVMAALAGGLLMVGMLGMKLAKGFGVDVGKVKNWLETLNIWAIASAFLCIMALTVVFSYWVSKRILQKKEF